MDVGQILAEAREKRGLTLADISQTTKIPVHVLGSIEHNDVAHLPQGFFTRAFVRAYANEVGVDAEELLDKSDVGEVEQVAVEVPTPSVPIQEPASSKSTFIAFALGVACAIFYSGYASQSASPAVPSVAVTSQVAAPVAAPAPCTPVAPAEPVTTAPPMARRSTTAPRSEKTEPAVQPVPVKHMNPNAAADAPAPAVESSPEPAASPASIEQF